MNSLFWVNLLIGCGWLLIGFKQLAEIGSDFSGKRESALG